MSVLFCLQKIMALVDFPGAIIFSISCVEYLIVFGEQLLISQFVVAGGAFFRCFLSFADVPAVPASPFYRSILFKDFSFFQVGKEFPIPCFMANFCFCDFPPDLGNFRKAFLVRYLCKFVKGRPLRFSPSAASARFSAVVPITPAG